MGRLRDGRTDGQIYRQMDRRTKAQRGGQTERQTNGQTEKGAKDGWAD